MGREFLDVFSGWAEDYDTFVEGQDEEYKEVFANYDEILDEIVSRSGDLVLEFGVGTGNLTQKLLDAGKTVIPIEPSKEMRDLAEKKLKGKVIVQDGDLQTFEEPNQKVDTIVSSYVFHHLTDEEKIEMVGKYTSLLKEGGKIVFADTLFIDEDAYSEIIEEARNMGYHNLVEDLEREYYPTFKTIYTALNETGIKQLNFKKMNRFVWVYEGQK